MMFKLPNNHPIIQSMSKKIIYLIIIFFVSLNINAQEKTNFFTKGKKNFEKKLYDEAKINFEKNIVREPRDSASYLYLSKIFNIKKQSAEFEKNLNTVLLLDPKNEEALYMLITKKMTDGDYNLAKKKFDIFKQSCKKLCEKKIELNNLIKKSKN